MDLKNEKKRLNKEFEDLVKDEKTHSKKMKELEKTLHGKRNIDYAIEAKECIQRNKEESIPLLHSEDRVKLIYAVIDYKKTALAHVDILTKLDAKERKILELRKEIADPKGEKRKKLERKHIDALAKRTAADLSLDSAVNKAKKKLDQHDKKVEEYMKNSKTFKELNYELGKKKEEIENYRATHYPPQTGLSIFFAKLQLKYHVQTYETQTEIVKEDLQIEQKYQKIQPWRNLNLSDKRETPLAKQEKFLQKYFKLEFEKYQSAKTDLARYGKRIETYKSKINKGMKPNEKKRIEIISAIVNYNESVRKYIASLQGVNKYDKDLCSISVEIKDPKSRRRKELENKARSKNIKIKQKYTKKLSEYENEQINNQKRNKVFREYNYVPGNAQKELETFFLNHYKDDFEKVYKIAVESIEQVFPDDKKQKEDITKVSGKNSTPPHYEEVSENQKIALKDILELQKLELEETPPRYSHPGAPPRESTSQTYTEERPEPAVRQMSDDSQLARRVIETWRGRLPKYDEIKQDRVLDRGLEGARATGTATAISPLRLTQLESIRRSERQHEISSERRNFSSRFQGELGGRQARLGSLTQAASREAQNRQTAQHRSATNRRRLERS